MSAKFDFVPAKVRLGKGIVEILASERGVFADALEIADESAQAHVEGECHQLDYDGIEWNDLSEIEGQYVERIMHSVSYLETRGILIRHPDNAQLVRVRETPA